MYLVFLDKFVTVSDGACLEDPEDEDIVARVREYPDISVFPHEVVFFPVGCSDLLVAEGLAVLAVD